MNFDVLVEVKCPECDIEMVGEINTDTNIVNPGEWIKFNCLQCSNEVFVKLSKKEICS